MIAMLHISRFQRDHHTTIAAFFRPLGSLGKNRPVAARNRPPFGQTIKSILTFESTPDAPTYQISNLKSAFSNLNSAISNLNSEISSLNSEISNLKSALIPPPQPEANAIAHKLSHPSSLKQHELPTMSGLYPAHLLINFCTFGTNFTGKAIIVSRVFR